MANKIQFRRDVGSSWVLKNPILSDGELGLETDSGLFKIGTGLLPWNSLPYSSGNSGTFQSALMPNIEDPIPPDENNMRLYTSSISGRLFPKFMGPSGLSTSVQPLLARNKIGYWCPSGNSNTAPGILGYTPHTAVGTVVKNVSITNLFTRMRRIGFNSAATAGSASSTRVAVAQVSLSNGLGQGGFFKVCRWGIADTTLSPTARTFVGVSATTTALTGVEPSTMTNSIGMGHGSADTNMFIYYGGSIAQPPIDLGPDFPCNTSNTDVYELALFAPPNNTGIHWQVTRLNTGHVASGFIAATSLNVTLPSDQTLLSYHQSVRSNGSTAGVVSFDIMSDYIETDY